MNHETVKGDSAERMVENNLADNCKHFSKCFVEGCCSGDCINATTDRMSEANSVQLIVETKFCHTHKEYSEDLPLCPDCKSPLDMDLPK